MDAASADHMIRHELQEVPLPVRQGEEQIRVAALSEMPQVGEALEFRLVNKRICIANVGGELCAINNSCPHLGASLSRGRIRDGKIVCPLHGWPFDLKTGETPVRPTTRACIYKITIEDGDVLVNPL